ncbi:hypothetical protein Leryth_000015 [Lithospermum erythrorhizon]|nr:hypothetical protein Leryth_000015 [Lithospermum erythrorhizon]
MSNMGIYNVVPNDQYVDNHAVLITGFGMLGDTPFYQVLNSWGPCYHGDGYLLVNRYLFTEFYAINDITFE